MKTRNLKIIQGYQYEIIKKDGEIIRITGKKIAGNPSKKFAEKLVEELE